MALQANIPQIAALRGEIEALEGNALHTHLHFVALTEKIEDRLREHISPTTLEHVWGYSTRHYDTISLRTLDVLARYIGCDSREGSCIWTVSNMLELLSVRTYDMPWGRVMG